jgi:hypothetical protein
MEEAVPGEGVGVEVTLTEACAFFDESAALVAVTAKVPALLPAVYRPEEEMEPPVADQVIAVFEDPVTVAENCFVEPVCTEAEVGVMDTVTEAGGGVELMVTVA